MSRRHHNQSTMEVEPGKFEPNKQRWSREHKARGQGHKKILGQGQGQPIRGQTHSRPRTPTASASPPKKKVFKKIFSVDPRKKKKKGLQPQFLVNLPKKWSPKIFSSGLQNFNVSENCAVLEPMTGQFSRT